jgi:flagellar biogenesis protein FliO
MNAHALMLVSTIAGASEAPIGQPDAGLPLRPLIVTLAAAALGAGAVALAKKKRRAAGTDRTIDVVASTALSPKVRVVLVRTEGREMLLSVGTEGASLLSEWSELADTADLEIPAPKPAPKHRIEPAALASDWSPAVEGILALRKRNVA